MVRRALCFILAAVLPALPACSDTDPGQQSQQTGKDKSELDVIGLATRPASLLVLGPATDSAARLRFERTLTRIGGSVIASLPPRLVIAQLPDRAEAMLANLGVVARFDRAIVPGDIPSATLPESRFAAVYSNRWYPAGVASADRIVARRAVRKANEPFEAPARVLEGAAGIAAADPEDNVSVPYASGTIVVSILLPESNGSIDPSTENWTEEYIREAYFKVQTALDNVLQSEPNANLRFLLHFESAPASGGLAGTIDTPYEFGQRAQWGDWANESLATASVLSKVLGRVIDPGVVQTAASEYQLALRKKYNADAAFFVMVAANQNFTAGLRAHAYFNGPWTTLDSQAPSNTFMHEFGHIFGAADEYCPDACSSPLSRHGYLGIYNANAEYVEGTYGGINNGKGEGANSLMISNATGSVNGYTRGAWGWMDRDGDGIIEVRDTFPQSQLTASVSGRVVRLSGQIVDRPEPSGLNYFTGAYSVNHLTSLNVEIVRAGTLIDTIDLPLPGITRGRETVSLALPSLPRGDYLFRIRAKNEVGNVEPVPAEVRATITTSGNNPPIPHLTLPDTKAVSSSRNWSINAKAVDPDGGTAQVRVDLGANGTWDTGWGSQWTLDVRPNPGIYPIVVQARDSSGASASTRGELLVFDGNAPPTVRLDAVPSMVHGTASAALNLKATGSDPEGSGLEYSFIAALATADGTFRTETGWGSSNQFSVSLPTPERLASRSFNFAPGNPDLGQLIQDIVPIGTTAIAVGGGGQGVWFVDMTTPAAPTILSRLELQTPANKLWRDGNRLYVIGTRLTVVDITDLRNPIEILQTAPTDDVVSSEVLEETPIAEPKGGHHSHYLSPGDKIESSEIQVTIDHPQPADLRVVLVPPYSSGLGPITLRDKAAAPAGENTWTFNTANTPDLAQLRGRLASEDWTISISDDVVNGVVGVIKSTRLDFQTRSYAARVLPDANQIVGKLSTGDLVVAGKGVQVLSIALPSAITERSRVDGNGTVGATLSGNIVVVAATLQDKKPTRVVDPLKGLYAVDLAIPTAPRVVRQLTNLGSPEIFARVGTRAYVRVRPDCEVGTPGCEDPKPSTLVVNVSTFASNGAAWKLGESPLSFESHAFGTDQVMWTTAEKGNLQRYDVTDPANLRVAYDYLQNRGQYVVPVGPLSDGSDMLSYEYGNVGALLDRDRPLNTLSRVYHLTAEVRDAAGAITRETRTVHVNPYDHAPTITRVDRTQGTHAGQPMYFNVFGTDPDASQIWNPEANFRVDWEGDGVFDTNWNYLTPDGSSATTTEHVFPRAGTYQAVFEVRDGYYAATRFPRTIVVQ